MSTAFYSHPVALLHDMGPGHPENPGRLRAIQAHLQQHPEIELDYREPSLATREQLLRIHTADYIDSIFSRTPGDGLVHLDGDTAMNPHSLQSALLAAGAVIDATDFVLDGSDRRAFCAMRPPGHHAEPGRAMGFCLFGNIAAGAAHALNHHRLERVAIVDFDVHHGNGTEAIFRNDPRVLFCSTFQHPFYPYPDLHNAPAHIVHAPLSAGSTGQDFRNAVIEHVIPALHRHQPQLVFISAGFDAHRDDPLGGLLLDEEDFSWITKTLCELATTTCEGRIVSTLEGGYDQPALARSVALHLRELCC